MSDTDSWARWQRARAGAGVLAEVLPNTKRGWLPNDRTDFIRQVGAEVGLETNPTPQVNCWSLKQPGGYVLRLWVRPKPHDAKHDAELFDSWWPGEWYKHNRRVRQVVDYGSIEYCIFRAATLFKNWDACYRLGGKPESVVAMKLR